MVRGISFHPRKLKLIYCPEILIRVKYHYYLKRATMLWVMGMGGKRGSSSAFHQPLVSALKCFEQTLGECGLMFCVLFHACSGLKTPTDQLFYLVGPVWLTSSESMKTLFSLFSLSSGQWLQSEKAERSWSRKFKITLVGAWKYFQRNKKDLTKQ